MIKSFLMSFLCGWLTFANHIYSQPESRTAATFGIHIFSSSNYLGYLEPCG